MLYLEKTEREQMQKMLAIIYKLWKISLLKKHMQKCINDVFKRTFCHLRNLLLVATKSDCQHVLKKAPY